MEIQIAENLYLRKISMEDLENYYSCFQSNSVSENFVYIPNSIEVAEKELSARINEYNKKMPRSEILAIIYEENFAGFITIEDLNQPYSEHKAEIGFCLLPQYFGKSIATRTVIATTEYVFKKYKLKRLFATCKKHNKASARVLEKSGFQLEGILRKNSFLNGMYVDDMMWSKIK